MAFASVGALLTDNQKSSSSSWTTSATLTNQLAVGNVGVLLVATDNVATTTGPSTLHSTLTDSVGNVWRKLREYTDSGGSAGSGVTESAWWSVADVTLSTSGTLTLGLASAVTAKAVSGWVFTHASGRRIATQSGADRSDNLTGAGSMTLSSLTNIEHLFVRSIGAEGLAIALVASASFTKFTDAGTGNTGLTDIQIVGEWRILTGTSGTSAPTTVATDNQASSFQALDDVLAVDLYDASAASVFMEVTPLSRVDLYDASAASVFMEVTPLSRVDLYDSSSLGFQYLELTSNTQHGLAALSAHATVDVTAGVVRAAVASLSAQATITAAAINLREAAAVPSAHATLTAAAANAKVTAADLSAHATVTATGRILHNGLVVLSAHAVVDATGALDPVATAPLSANAILRANGVKMASPQISWCRMTQHS